MELEAFERWCESTHTHGLSQLWPSMYLRTACIATGHTFLTPTPSWVQTSSKLTFPVTEKRAILEATHIEILHTAHYVIQSSENTPHIVGPEASHPKTLLAALGRMPLSFFVRYGRIDERKTSMVRDIFTND